MKKLELWTKKINKKNKYISNLSFALIFLEIENFTMWIANMWYYFI